MDVMQLTRDEWADRDRLEKIVEDNLVTWMQVGLALKEIKERELYRTTHDSWEQYVKDRFDIARSTSYQLTSGVEVVENVRNADIEFPFFPEKEALVRPLTKLEPEEQPRAWKLAIDRARDMEEKTVMARHVIWAVQAMRGQTGGETLRGKIKNVMEDLPETFRDAFKTITESIYEAKRNRFVGVDRKKMLDMLDGLRRLIEG
ncbi:hypothetical protein DSCW_18540 [Desulfosarcina widdelii]|uniref:Uncharacterized protein n=2 Tax=Desulfosarcina widdelii TaxID=947919 RepID=A0A5K7ZDW0_9BACT|nr:hypothetical protein DSCW_18540 [Desulfosarcina widdelii]